MEFLNLDEGKLIILLQVMNNSDEINSFLHEQLSEQGSRVDEFSRRRLIENQDTIHELTGRIQELQNEVNCMNDSRVFKDAESVRSGLSHVPSRPALLPPNRDPGGMLSRSVGMLSRNDKPPVNWDTHGILRNVFVNPPASSSSPYPGGFNPWIPNVTEDTSPHVTSERQNEDTARDPRCQSGPSARNSTLMREDFQRIMGQTNKRLQISDLHFDKFLRQQPLLVGR